MKNILKLYRTKSGYTQEEISKKIGVSRQTINSIENNRFHPSILLCLKLSKELDCRVKDQNNDFRYLHLVFQDSQSHF